MRPLVLVHVLEEIECRWYQLQVKKEFIKFFKLILYSIDWKKFFFFFVALQPQEPQNAGAGGGGGGGNQDNVSFGSLSPITAGGSPNPANLNLNIGRLSGLTDESCDDQNPELEVSLKTYLILFLLNSFFIYIYI